MPTKGKQMVFAYVYVPAGVFVIYKCLRGAARLYHTLSPGLSFSKAAVYNLELADNAELGYFFGAMLVAIECGDKRRLLPVPSCAALFADMMGSALSTRQ